MSQNQENLIPTGTPLEATKPITWRTPGRKLTKEDLSTTSALILGCTTQCCPKEPDCSGPPPITETV